MSKQKIVIFSGAGLDRESGIATFRDTDDGLWNNYKIDDVATPKGWTNDRELVNKFYNERRAELEDVDPNKAHKLIAQLEEQHDVINITQNVSDLLERGGSTKVLHLHGELTKARSTFDDEIIDMGYRPITDDVRCSNNAILRPHVVWFGEMPFNTTEAHDSISSADVIVIIGTTFNIGYTVELINALKPDTPVYVIDPRPPSVIRVNQDRVLNLPTTATEGMKYISNLFKK